MTLYKKILPIAMLALLSIAAMAWAPASAAPQAQETPTPSPEPSQTDEAALRATLTTLLQEHVYLTLIATQVINDDDGSPDEAQAVLQERNTAALGDLVGELYSEDVRSRFLQVWENKVSVTYSFAEAVDDNEEDEIQAALEMFAGLVDEMTNLIGQADSEIDQNEFQQRLMRHIELVLVAIAYQEGEYAVESLLQGGGVPEGANSAPEAAFLAARQAAEIAEALTPAIAADQEDESGE